MTCFELRAVLEDLGLTQRDLVRLSGAAGSQVWRWCDGFSPVPEYVRTLLTLMKTDDRLSVVFGHRQYWGVERHHLFRKGATFRKLLHRWHLDKNARDTNGEMKIVLQFRE
ncbi:hypothetical protein [Hyphomicrobium sp. DY-1]|uniref:hypothetical protein n=1 Tax=Hyphomicrobium sp. DY-1 TaxID=3075650 RepID=UPI0039C43606